MAQISAIRGSEPKRKSASAQPVDAAEATTAARTNLCTRAETRVLLAIALSLSAVACTVRSRRPDGPYRDALELVDALSDDAVACVRKLSPKGPGQIDIAADLSHAHEPPVIHDAGSSPGTAAVITCIRERAIQKLHNPATAPGPIARIRVPLPLVTSQITYAFMEALPAAKPAP